MINKGVNLFISYSLKDKESIDLLISKLEAANHKVWIDRNNIRGGSRWAAEIFDGIKDCDVFIVILTPDSIQSKYVKRELSIADDEEKPIIPILIKSILRAKIPSEMRFYLTDIHWLNFIDDFEDGVSRLLHILSQKAAKNPQESIKPIYTLPFPSNDREKVSIVGTGIVVIPTLIAYTSLSSESHDIVKNELKWLFTAADHFIKVMCGQKDVHTPVSFPIPKNISLSPGVNNLILIDISSPEAQEYKLRLEELTLNINKTLDILNFELVKDVELTGSDPSLKYSIKSRLKEILNNTLILAQIIGHIYGIMVHSPNDLIHYMNY